MPDGDNDYMISRLQLDMLKLKKKFPKDKPNPKYESKLKIETNTGCTKTIFNRTDWEKVKGTSSSRRQGASSGHMGRQQPC